MTRRHEHNLERSWSRLGVLLNVAPARATPDLERLLLDTARHLGENARLYPLVVTWLAEYSNFVARHRLKRLVVDELETEHQAALGLLLEFAIEHSASKDLGIASAVCSPARRAAPLFKVQQSDARLRAIAKHHASALSRTWGMWAPTVALKRDAIRPVTWLLKRNPDYRDRIIRKGDLRCSIIETLRHDGPDGVVRSESELARLAGANRSAVRKALAALIQEGAVTVAAEPFNDRDHPVRLQAA